MKMHQLVYAVAAVCLLGSGAPSGAAESGTKAKPPAENSSAVDVPAVMAEPSSADDKWFDGIRLKWPGKRGEPRVEDDKLKGASAEMPPAATVPHLGPLEESDFQDLANEPAAFPEGRIVPLYEEGGYYSNTSYASGQPYTWQLMPQGLIYRSYLAGAKELRFRSVWHHENTQGNIWDITLGGNVGLARYGTRGDVRPEGWQLGIEGAGLIRLDTEENRDVDAADYRFGVPMTWGDSIYQVKFAYYHLSSHLGDEFLLKHPGYPRLNYSRDVLVWGHSLYPRENWRVYGEVGYAFYNDVGQPWETQFGIDFSPNYRTGIHGAPFAALNGHLRQEVDFGGNFVAQAGWAWRRSPATGLYRVGFEYYNGKDDQFSFFNNSVEKYGFGMWYDY